MSSEEDAKAKAKEIVENVGMTQGMMLPPFLDVKENITFPTLIKQS